MPSLPDSARKAADPGLAERVEGIAAWIGDLDARLRAAELATGDEKTAKELRRALEALSKHDPKLEKRLTDRVDVLVDRMSTLASTVSTTASALAKKDGEIAALRHELEGDSKRIETLVREYGRTVGAEEVEKLRAAIRAVSHERPARTSDQHADELTGKVDVLAQRVDTLAKTVATTAAGLAGREGEIVGLRQRLDEGSSRIEATVAELHRVQGDDVLAEQLESLRRAVAATAAGLAGRESEIAGVRARIDEAYARVGSVVSDIQGSIAALSSQVVTLEELPGATEQALEERAAELRAGIDGLAERLDSLATSVESTLGGLADRELEVTGLNRSVDEVSSRVDAVVAELRQALSELPPPGSVDPAVDARFEELSGAVLTVTGQLTELESLSFERTRNAASQAVEIEGLLAEVGERLDTVERDRDAAAARLTRADEVWTEEREWVRGRLETLAAEHADSSQTHESLGPQLDELGARLERLDGEHSAVAVEIARVSQTLDAEREALHAQLDGLAATMAEAGTSHGSDDSERLLAELAGRLDNVEQDGAAVACEIARTAAFWASELESIEARLDHAGSANGHALATGDEGTERLLAELGGRLDAMERDRRAVADEVTRASDAWTAERSSLEVRLDEIATHLAEVESDAREATPASSSEDEVAEVRVLVDGLRMRLASNEKELATLVSAREVGGRLDEVGRRLESLERAPVVIATSADGGPLPGDGRFRLELRALELRMEHAEAAARENREAVLVQLERLAARIEWRFQRLEAQHDAAYPEAVGGGAQVVPIRPLET